MSAFDDEFGLFGEDAEDAEPRSTLGARNISSQETIIDEVEPEDERPPKPAGTSRDREPRRERGGSGGGGGRRSSQPYRREHRQSEDPWASARRATDLLGFVARKLVSNAEAVNVELFTDEEGKPVIELIVDPEDLGKVIGRSGRVAQALRTIVRATAEGRISVDILDAEEAAESPVDNPQA